MQNKMKGNQKIIFIYSYKYIYIYSRYATNISQGLYRCWTRVAFVGVTCCCCRNLISILILLMVCNSLRAAVSRVRCYIWHWRSVFWFDPIISVNLCTISCCCVVVVVKQQQRRHWCCEKECDCNYYLIFACFCLYICHMFAHWHTHTHARSFASKYNHDFQHWTAAPAGLTRPRLAHILTHISQQLRIIYANQPTAFLAFHYYLSVISCKYTVHAIRIHILKLFLSI